MAKLTGTNPDQVPTNADLGTMAYQDKDNVKVGSFTSNGIDDNATSTAMTLDSSGNLLVGTTDTNLSNNTGTDTGFGVISGELQVARDGGVAMFNRTSTDGAIATFRKDGTTVGSIASKDGSNIIVGSNNCGLSFQTGTVRPRTMANGTSDGVNDLGTSDSRFKDLYLSGGVYLGGTGSANKLDDYESGTWTPVFRGGTSAGSYTYGEQQGHYIKIGDQVTAWCNLTNIATTTAGSGIIQISGLPFAANWMSNFNGDAVGSFSVNGFTGLDGDYIMVVVPDNTSSIFLYKQTGTNNTTTVIDVTDKVGSGSDCRGFVTYYVGG